MKFFDFLDYTLPSQYLLPIHREDGSIHCGFVTFDVFVFIWWSMTLIYAITIIPKRFLSLVRKGERRRILDELVHTKSHLRNSKLFDMCYPWIGSSDFGTDELMLHLDSKFKIMEDAGMFGADGRVLHELSWGFLEDDLFIGKMLESNRARDRSGKNIFVEGFWDVCGRRPDWFVALCGNAKGMRMDLEEWKKKRDVVKSEKCGYILVDLE